MQNTELFRLVYTKLNLYLTLDKRIQLQKQ